MILKKRFANLPDHKSIVDSNYNTMEFKENNFSGNISLVSIKNVKKNWYVDEEERCVLAPNYKWLEIYPKDENFCITTMFDDKEQIIEFYIDISKEIGSENGVPYELDLFLDVVILPDGRTHILDADELQNAFDEKLITKEEFDMAHHLANKIITNATNENIERLSNFSYKYLKLLK